VYNKDTTDNTLYTLKSPQQIEQSIRQYLRNIVEQYNISISEQITKQPTYFNNNLQIFSQLGTIDPFATPARTYVLIDTNLLNNSITNEMISSIAQMLYIQHSILPKKRITQNLQEELDQVETLSNITNKKRNIIDRYITRQTLSTPLSLP
jgi:ribosomal protein S17E